MRVSRCTPCVVRARHRRRHELRRALLSGRVHFVDGDPVEHRQLIENLPRLHTSGNRMSA